MITYRTRYSATPASFKGLCKQLLENDLYQEGRVFKKWYADPECYFENGAIISYASIGDEIVGVGILNFKFYAYTTSIDIMGLLGYYVKEEYRGSGIGSQLTRNINDRYKKSCYKKSCEETRKVVLACHSGFTLSTAYSTAFETRKF